MVIIDQGLHDLSRRTRVDNGRRMVPCKEQKTPWYTLGNHCMVRWPERLPGRSCLVLPALVGQLANLAQELPGQALRLTDWLSRQSEDQPELRHMIGIEIGVLRDQCFGRRIGERERLVSKINAWERARNASGARIRSVQRLLRRRPTAIPRPGRDPHRMARVVTGGAADDGHGG